MKPRYDYIKTFVFNQPSYAALTVNALMTSTQDWLFQGCEFGIFLTHFYLDAISNDAGAGYLGWYNGKDAISYAEISDASGGLLGDWQTLDSQPSTDRDTLTLAFHHMIDFKENPVYIPNRRIRVRIRYILSNYTPVGAMTYRYWGYFSIGFKGAPEEFKMVTQ